ncbi:MAG TPA: ferritin family protein [Candidatus Thermoplasmatota archaeon]|nr:ferritin family protein [Candidatus Thermoplasmatota archaeon]
MRPELNDIRLLKLAEFYETAYERFVVELATYVVRDDETRRRLAKLLEGDHHERIVRELERLNARMREDDAAGVLRAAILDVVEVESAARDFYRDNAERVHDGVVARLFRELAREEEGHVRIAEAALHDAEERRVAAAGVGIEGTSQTRLFPKGTPGPGGRP